MLGQVGGVWPLRVDDYQRQAVASDQSGGRAPARYLLLGLFGEAGGVLTAVKKRERDKEATEKYISQVMEELGDLMWYIATVASRNGARLSSLVAPLMGAPSVPRNSIEFSHLQRPRSRIMIEPSEYLEYRLVELAAAVGRLVSDQTQSLHTRTHRSAAAAFTEVLKRLVQPRRKCVGWRTDAGCVNRCLPA